MTATNAPATSAGAGGRHALTRREADAWLKAHYPRLSRSARERIASVVPTILRDHPNVDVMRWLADSARVGDVAWEHLTRGSNPTMRVGLGLAGRSHLAREFDDLERGESA